jgi:peptidoglycan/xylan/chitin deacetylase (PgdA/CDA1 family)
VRAILTYHSLDGSGSPISVAPAVFREHVEWLARSRFAVIPLERMLDAGIPADAVALTFDDGFANVGTVALPLLADHQMTATVFVVSDHVGATNRWRGRADPGIPELPLLGWTDLARATERGVTLGAHSRTHRSLRGLDRGALDDEMGGSADRISRETGRAPAAFAYPYGDYDPTAVEAARRFRCACTTEHRQLRATEDPARLPRLDMYYFRAPGQLAWLASPSFAARVWARRVARRLRRLTTARRG